METKLKTLASLFYLTCCMTALWISGCASGQYVDARKTLKNMKKTKHHLVKEQDKLNADYQDKRNVYNQLLQFGASSIKSPYPQLNNLLDRMASKLDKSKVGIGKIHRSIYLLKQGLKEWGRATINEGEQEWEIVQGYRKNLSRIMNEKYKVRKEYKKLSENFLKITKKNSISVIKVKKLRENILAVIGKLSLEIANALDLIKSTQYTASMMSSDKQIMNRKSTAKILKISKDIKIQKKSLLALKNQFDVETVHRDNMPVAPHMATFKIRTKIRSIEKRFQSLQGVYNSEISFMFGG